PVRDPSKTALLFRDPLAPVSVPGAILRYRSPLASDRPSPACRHISLTRSSDTPPSFSFQ
ncbi:hypothetical protein LZ30DRAFT_534638, partial [Colletotrichum cereale]